MYLQQQCLGHDAEMHIKQGGEGMAARGYTSHYDRVAVADKLQLATRQHSVIITTCHTLARTSC